MSGKMFYSDIKKPTEPDAGELIPYPEKLEEDYRVDDLLDFSAVTSNFRGVLNRISNNSIVGLVGEFGSGKSTMLYQLYKEDQRSPNEKWIVFDAWKYPERRDLWEGFVLEVAKNLDKKTFEKARKKVDGERYKDVKSLIQVLGEGANFFLPGSGIVKNFAGLFKSSPVRRVFEFQEVLHEIIKKTDKDLFLIVEDIDRSGDKGLFFLETLRYFIKENKFDKKIIVIVPIGNDYFNENEKSYLKTVDYKVEFSPVGVDFKKFIKSVFSKGVVADDIQVEQINHILRTLLSRFHTIRKVKHILRRAQLTYSGLTEEEKTKVDKRLWVVFEAAKYGKESFYSTVSYQGTGEMIQMRKDFWGVRLLFMVSNGSISLDGLPEPNEHKIFFYGNFPIPTHEANSVHRELHGYRISDTYLNH